MTEQEFMKYAYYSSDLGDDFWDALNLDEIRKLPSQPEIIQNALLLWSRFMVGNVSGTADEINEMDSLDKRIVLRTWIDITKDVDQLRHIATFIANSIVK